MSWYPMGIPSWPFSFTELLDHVAFENDETGEVVRYVNGHEVADLQAENAKLRELFAEVWPIAEYAGYEHELERARELMRELGYEEE